jgi:hypothetical protein
MSENGSEFGKMWNIAGFMHTEIDGRATRLWLLLELLADPRRQASVKYPLPALIMIVLMAKMSGQPTFRGVAAFAERHEEKLKALFSIPSAPKFTAFRHGLLQVDPHALAKLLGGWEPPTAGAVVAADGKTVRSSVRDAEGAGRRAVDVLSVLDAATGRVLAAEGSSDGKKGEIRRLEAVLERLEGIAALTADALHCQKKRSPNSTGEKSATL